MKQHQKSTKRNLELKMELQRWFALFSVCFIQSFFSKIKLSISKSDMRNLTKQDKIKYYK